MAAKLGRMVTYLEGLLPIMSHDPLSCGLLRSRFETTTTVTIAIKFGKMLVYLDGIVPIISHDVFNVFDYVWSCKIT